MLSRWLLIVGAALSLLGLMAMQIPGPGFVLVVLGVAALLAGAVVAAVNRTRGSGGP